MCVRPPCENCGADYDSCYEKCPHCGHPNSEPGVSIQVPYEALKWPEPEEKELPCKVCKTTHKVLVMRMVD